MRRISLSLVLTSTLVVITVLAIPAFGVITVFNVNMTGAKELAGGAASADLDGSAIGTITLDDSGIISWNLALSNVALITDFHIHTGGPTQQAPPFIALGVQGGDTNSLSQFIGTRNGLNTTNIATVLANPGGYYFNLHNAEFPGGAVRDQVPEPGTFGALLFASGLLGLRRRKV